MRSIVRILATCWRCAMVAPIVLAAQPAPKLFVAGRFHRGRYDANAKNQQGWGAVLQPFFDQRKLRVVERRARRPQQPHVHHRRPLGPDARRGARRRLRDHPVRTQRRRRDQPGTAGLDATAARARHAPGHRRRVRRNRQRAHGQARDRLLVRLVPAENDRRHAREGRHADPADAHQDQQLEGRTHSLPVGHLSALDLADGAGREDRVRRSHAHHRATASSARGRTRSRRSSSTTPCTRTSRAPKPMRATWSSALRAIKALPFRTMLSAAGRGVPADRGAAENSVCPQL